MEQERHTELSMIIVFPDDDKKKEFLETHTGKFEYSPQNIIDCTHIDDEDYFLNKFFYYILEFEDEIKSEDNTNIKDLTFMLMENLSASKKTSMANRLKIRTSLYDIFEMDSAYQRLFCKYLSTQKLKNRNVSGIKITNLKEQSTYLFIDFKALSSIEKTN